MIQDDRDRRIYRLIEKPRNPSNNIRGTGNWVFRSAIVDYLDLTPVVNQSRGEKELPDLIFHEEQSILDLDQAGGQTIPTDYRGPDVTAFAQAAQIALEDFLFGLPSISNFEIRISNVPRDGPFFSSVLLLPR